MQLVLPWLGSAKRASSKPAELQVGAENYPISITRHRRARRFILRMTAAGGLRLTVPRGASIADGLAFAKNQGAWIARERSRRAEAATPWADGTLVWFRGAQVPLAVLPSAVSWSTETVPLPDGHVAVRAAVEAHLRRLAAAELPSRCQELAARHRLVVNRVSIRNQRTRWGSCSTRGAISLNWRLVQMPPEVAEYVIVHELMHLKQPDHSRRFWREVAAVCDHWREAERWLRRSGKELL